VVIRAGAVAAGVVGVALAIAGGAGLIAKPDAVVWASAPLDRAVVFIPPQVIAMDGVMEIVVEGEPWMETRSARPVDAYAWHRGESSIYVQGVSSWTEVKTLKPDLYSYDGNELTGDIWRSNTVSAGATHIFPADVPAGLAVVVVTRSHGPLSKISIELSRDPGYGWAWPALSAGALLAAVSMVLFALLWLDLRPARAGDKEVTESQAETTDVVAKRDKRAPLDEGAAEGGREPRARRERSGKREPENVAEPRGEPEAKVTPEPTDAREKPSGPRPRRARRAENEEDAK
jgi:hypothetical protein